MAKGYWLSVVADRLCCKSIDEQMTDKVAIM